MIENLIAIGASLVSLFVLMFGSYQKGKRDLKNKQTRDLVNDYVYKTKSDKKYRNRTITNDDRKRLSKKWSKK